MSKEETPIGLQLSIPIYNHLKWTIQKLRYFNEYQQTNRKTKLMNKILHFILYKIFLPFALIFAAIVSTMMVGGLLWLVFNRA